MKKKGLLIALAVLVVGVGVYFGMSALSNGKPSDEHVIDRLEKHYLDYKVSESETELKYEYKPEFFETLAASQPGVMTGDLQLIQNLMQKIMNNFTLKQSGRLVLDSSREDFGLDFDLQYVYGEDTLITLGLASDLKSEVLVKVPELLSKGVKFSTESVPEVAEKIIDIKPYMDILCKNDAPENVKKTYIDMLKAFCTEDRLEDLGMSKVEVGGKKLSVQGYHFHVTYKEYMELIESMLNTLKQDQEAREYIVGKIDSLVNLFVESGDYEFFELTKEEVQTGYAELKEEALADIDAGEFNVMEEYEKALSELPEEQRALSSFDNMTMDYTVYIDKDDYMRKMDVVVDTPMMKVTATSSYLAVGDEVKVKPIIDSSDVYAFEGEYNEADLEIFAKTLGLEAVDNLGENVIGGKAVEHIVEDLKKVVEESDDFEGKDELLVQLDGFVKNTKQQLQFLKYFLQQ